MPAQEPTVMNAAPPAPGDPPAKRDWVEWYESLGADERRGMRERLVLAAPDDVRADDELKHFFLFHVDDLVADQPPGVRRLTEFYHVVTNLRGREELAAERKKYVAYLLAEYQHYLRDNPFVT